MKQQFSFYWASSKQSRKQRKFVYNSPLHLRHRFLSANLSKELRIKYKTRNLPLRKGDEVRIMRGSFANKKAKISKINVKLTGVVLEGINRTKRDGSKIEVYFHPSNLQIVSINADDKKRLKNIYKIEMKEKQKNALNKSQTN